MYWPRAPPGRNPSGRDESERLWPLLMFQLWHLLYVEEGLTDSPSFTWDDVSGDPNAAVISVGAAKAMFADREPVGETFDNGDGRQFHVIGVVGDVRTALFFEQPPRVYAFPAPQLRRDRQAQGRTRRGAWRVGRERAARAAQDSRRRAGPLARPSSGSVIASAPTMPIAIRAFR